MMLTQNNKTITSWRNYKGIVYERYWCIYNHHPHCYPLSFSLSISRVELCKREMGEFSIHSSEIWFLFTYISHSTLFLCKARIGVDLIFTLYLRRRRRHFSIFVEYSFWHRLLIRSRPIELQLYIQYLTT